MKHTTTIYELRERWFKQIKASPYPHQHLTRKQKRISGRAGRTAWQIMLKELVALCKTGRYPAKLRPTQAPDTFAIGYGNEQSL